MPLCRLIMERERHAIGKQRQRIAAGDLMDFAAAALHSAGVPIEDARLVADSLVQADLWGHESHGVMRLSTYLKRLASAVMRAVTEARVISESGAVAVWDGGDGLGQVIATRAMQSAMQRASVHGVSAISVRNSNHFGTAMYFTRMAPLRGQIALLMTNASPAMAPWGGTLATVGTNPWSIGAPAGRYPPLLLDIANTSVARGKIILAQQQGQAIPAGWAADRRGEATTDPGQALAGLLLPMGGHKGYCIAVMIDVLAGVLSGSSYAGAVQGPYQAERRSGCGHLLVVLNISAFMPLREFNARAEDLIRQLKSVPPAAGHAEVLYPGEQEARSEERARLEGIALPAETLADLEQIARTAGIAAPVMRTHG
jgi:LDH2 family malate/lactate/ureidoglycolate dehydrogenase